MKKGVDSSIPWAQSLRREVWWAGLWRRSTLGRLPVVVTGEWGELEKTRDELECEEVLYNLYLFIVCNNIIA